MLASRDRQHPEMLLDLQTVGAWSIMDDNGPVWFRGFAQWSPEEGEPQVIGLLDRYSASRFVVGHTISSTRRVTARFGARVSLIDTSMLSSHYRGGRAVALEIEDYRITAVYLGERLAAGDHLRHQGRASLPRTRLAGTSVTLPQSAMLQIVPNVNPLSRSAGMSCAAASTA